MLWPCHGIITWEMTKRITTYHLYLAFRKVCHYNETIWWCSLCHHMLHKLLFLVTMIKVNIVTPNIVTWKTAFVLSLGNFFSKPNVTFGYEVQTKCSLNHKVTITFVWSRRCKYQGSIVFLFHFLSLFKSFKKYCSFMRSC